MHVLPILQYGVNKIDSKIHINMDNKLVFNDCQHLLNVKFQFERKYEFGKMRSGLYTSQIFLSNNVVDVPVEKGSISQCEL